ncbi:response regulator transcription factor [Altererythrobacter arenosus]|uniref:Response regulator transcription factor n=1 Tax=Altererythrobacter arenosus TaxID=3032592 RepID=A0ABY8FPX9_9SPHN|nr:response regulator transcription factor [Altererythrobacter sp. CAU 1644]WFL76160.1 response regulator transcription factor [Altererythrobacter sp. CAU 1644]
MANTFIVADDHPICSSMITLAIRSRWDDAEIKTVTSLGALLGLLDDECTKLLILDLNLDDSSGLRTLAMVRGHHPDVPVLVFSANANDELIRGARALGADGILSKELTREDLALAIQTISEGRGLAQPIDMRDDVPRIPAGPLRVLPLLLEGLSNQGIADKLGLTQDTIKKHVATVLKALGVKSRGQAIIKLQSGGNPE